VSMTPAEAYEQCLVPAIFEPWARRALQARPPAPGDRVLDVACGTGIGARLAARIVGPGGSVVGVDVDDGMLAVARTTRGHTAEAPIEWRHASALELPGPAREFDYLLCLEGLQFFPDRSAALREMRRVLRPGGVLVGTVWGPLEQNPAYHALAEGLRRFVSEEAGRLPPFALPDADAIRAVVRAAGFGDPRVTLESLSLAVPSWTGSPPAAPRPATTWRSSGTTAGASSTSSSRPGSLHTGRAAACRCRARATSSSSADGR
jgi:SAM-dependent methyltransferase